MASNSICTSCLRSMRQHFGTTRKGAGLSQTLSVPSISARPPFQRTFANSERVRAAPKSASSAHPSTAPSPPPPPPRTTNPPPSSGAIANFAAQLRKTEALRSTTEPYVAYGGTEDLFLECSRQCTYTVPTALTDPPTEAPQTASGEDLGDGSGWWLESRDSTSTSTTTTGGGGGGLGLPVTFNAWAQVLFLHMWMLTVRLRAFPAAYVRNWHQNLLDHFFYAAEDRMATWHRLSARSERNKYLKELWVQWRGVLLSYDEGLIKGDAVLAAAIWRNVFKADPNVDLNDLAVVTAYTMRELRKLGDLTDEAVAMGQVKFGDPREVRREMMGKESPWTRKSVTPAELQALQQQTVETST